MFVAMGLLCGWHHAVHVHMHWAHLHLRHRRHRHHHPRYTVGTPRSIFTTYAHEGSEGEGDDDEDGTSSGEAAPAWPAAHIHACT